MSTLFKWGLYGAGVLAAYALFINQDKANSLVAATVAELVRYAGMVHFG